MNPVHIPELLHICPGCDDLTSGDEFCARCKPEIEAMHRRYLILREAERIRELQRLNVGLVMSPSSKRAAVVCSLLSVVVIAGIAWIIFN